MNRPDAMLALGFSIGTVSILLVLASGGGTSIVDYMDRHEGFFVGFFTLALVVATTFLWWSTRKLWIAGEEQIGVARQSAEAASRSAKVAEDALTKRERAFVFIKAIDADPIRGPGRVSPMINQIIDGNILLFRITPIWENSGSTPALRLVHCGGHSVFSRDLPADFEFPDMINPEHGLLGPNATLPSATFDISMAEIQNIEAGASKLFVWGWVDYDDIFEHTARHRTEFCSEVAVRRLGDAGTIELGFPIRSDFNAADGDCLRAPQPYKTAQGE